MYRYVDTSVTSHRQIAHYIFTRQNNVHSDMIIWSKHSLSEFYGYINIHASIIIKIDFKLDTISNNFQQCNANASATIEVRVL